MSCLAITLPGGGLAQPAIAAALAAPSAALFEKTATAGATPSGRGTTVTIKITVEAAE